MKPLTPEAQKRDELALQHNIINPYFSNYQPFCDGWNAALKHSPTVLALVEALDTLQKHPKDFRSQLEAVENLEAYKAATHE